MCKGSTSLLNDEFLLQSISEILEASCKKQRNFLEVVELQVSLMDYDPRRDKRFCGTVTCPHLANPGLSVCVFGTEEHCQEAKEAGIPFMTVDDLRGLNRNKKLVKKLWGSYDQFLASQVLIPQIPRILGPRLATVGRFPGIIAPGESLQSQVDRVRSKVKFQLKKVPSLGAAVGHVLLSAAQLQENIKKAIELLVSLLKKGWHNIKALHLKSSMGKPHVLFPSTLPTRKRQHKDSKDSKGLRFSSSPGEADDALCSVFLHEGQCGRRLASVIVAPTDLVSRVRDALLHQDMTSAKLFFKGKMLQDSERLESYAISDRARIVVVKDMPSSAEKEAIHIVISTLAGTTAAELHFEHSALLCHLRQRLLEGLELQYWQQLLISEEGQLLEGNHKSLTEWVSSGCCRLNLQLLLQTNAPADVNENTQAIMKMLKRPCDEQAAPKIISLLQGRRYDARFRSKSVRRGNKFLGGQSLLQSIIASMPDPFLLDAVSEIISCKADINASDPNGMQPLHVACRRGALHVVSLLLDMNADTNTLTPASDTALHLVLQHASQSDSPLIHAAGMPSLSEICSRLLTMGVRADHQNSCAKTCKNLMEDVVQRLRRQNRAVPSESDLTNAGLSLELLQAVGLV